MIQKKTIVKTIAEADKKNRDCEPRFGIVCPGVQAANGAPPSPAQRWRSHRACRRPFGSSSCPRRAALRSAPEPQRPRATAWPPEPRGAGAHAYWQHFPEFCNFLAGSFSAVSKPNFASEYAFRSIFQSLQDLHTFAPLKTKILEKTAGKISNFCENSAIFSTSCCKICNCFAEISRQLLIFKSIFC